MNETANSNPIKAKKIEKGINVNIAIINPEPNIWYKKVAKFLIKV